MDRHVEFSTQLARLVALYSRDTVEHAAEKAALRAARSAAKHGEVEFSLAAGQLRAGHQVAAADQPGIAALQALLTTLGVTRIQVAHHAEQDEVKHLAQLLGAVAAGRKTVLDFVGEVTEHAWQEVSIERIADATPRIEEVEAVAPETPAPMETEAAVAVAAEAAAPVAAGTDSPPMEGALTAGLAREVLSNAGAAIEPVEGEAGDAEELAAVPEALRKPLAERLPAVVDQLLGPEHRELFERLITASEPSTLRRLLDPVQVVIEQTVREGAVATTVRLLLAVFACEALAEDDETRRQFVVTLRRLTKPTLTRALAMLYGEAPDTSAEVEQVLARFGEDGAEAVADRIGCAPTREAREMYTALLRRLPGTNDALLAMLDDQREAVVERAIDLIVALRHPEMERVLGEQLSSRSTRVRQAAVRGLTVATESAFAADALVRAVQDAAPEVRLAAAVGLQLRREERLAAALIQRIDEEDELDVQLALVATLGSLVTPEGVEKLITLANPSERALRRRNLQVIRLGAIEAMGEARTPAAMVALQKLLENKEQEVRETAARLYSRARRQTAAMGIPAVSDS